MHGSDEASAVWASEVALIKHWSFKHVLSRVSILFHAAVYSYTLGISATSLYHLCYLDYTTRGFSGISFTRWWLSFPLHVPVYQYWYNYVCNWLCYCKNGSINEICTSIIIVIMVHDSIHKMNVNRLTVKKTYVITTHMQIITQYCSGFICMTMQRWLTCMRHPTGWPDVMPANPTEQEPRGATHRNMRNRTTHSRQSSMWPKRTSSQQLDLSSSVRVMT